MDVEVETGQDRPGLSGGHLVNSWGNGLGKEVVEYRHILSSLLICQERAGLKKCFKHWNTRSFTPVEIFSFIRIRVLAIYVNFHHSLMKLSNFKI